MDKQCGKRATKKREKYEEGLEAFKPGDIFQEMHKALDYTPRNETKIVLIGVNN